MGVGAKTGLVIAAVVGTVLAARLSLERKQQSRPRVWTELVAQQDVVEAFVGYGTVVGAPSVTVSAEVDGRVRAVTARAGQRVAARHPLLALDSNPFAWKVERARAAVAARDADRERAVLAVEQARRRAQWAEKERARVEDLFASGVQSDEAAAQARHRSWIAALEVAVQLQRVEVASAEALAAESELADALQEAARSIVRAPIAGEIMEIGVQRGEWVQAGAVGVAPTRLFTIAPDGALDVEVNVQQRQAARVQLGQIASVTLPTLASRPLRARVVSKLAAAPGPIDGTALMRLRLEELAPGVRVGFTGTVRIPIEERSRVPAIPNHALHSAPRRYGPRRPRPGARSTRTERAWVIRDGLVAERTLVAGFRGDTHTEILAGISLGEAVITGPYALVRSIGVGDAVIPIRAPLAGR